MASTFTVYNDPGHAWGKVALTELAKLGLTAADFSTYSYLKGPAIYLEEDCDLSKFAKAFADRNGKPAEWSERHSEGEARIRNYWPNTEQGRAYQAQGLI